MAKRTPPTYLTIWEQWLQRLSGSYSDEIRDDINRFELIESLATQAEINRLLCSRLGTIFNHFFPVEAITIHDMTDNELFFSTLPRSQEAKINSRLLGLVIRNRRIAEPVKIRAQLSLRGKNITLNYLYQLEVKSPSCRYIITFFATLPLENRELRFLSAVQSLLELRYQTAQKTRDLSSQNDRLKAVTQHLSEGLFILDRDLQVAGWNKPMQHITGFSSKEAIDRHYQQVFYRVDSPDWLRTLLQEQSQPDISRVFRQEFVIRTRNGQERWINVSGSFLTDEQNSIEQIVCIVRDVSKFKELEQRKSEFISIATHELRTPITAVKGYLSLIARNRDDLSDKHKFYLSQATIASERLVKLAEDLLQVVHVEEEQLKFAMKPTSLKPILAKVTADLKEKAEKKGLSLVLDDYPKTADKISQAQMIFADPIRVEQIFANLIDNAIKYTDKGEIHIHPYAELNRTTQTSDQVIEIIDTGNGISPRDLETIFDKFRRTETAHRSRQSGAGLGLFIVKSFVEKQGGKITVISRLGKGSTFKVAFPQKENKTKRRKK